MSHFTHAYAHVLSHPQAAALAKALATAAEHKGDTVGHH